MSRAKDKTSNKFDKSELLQNAITSIQLGVEDFQSIRSKNAPERSLSSARKIFAGVLLLFKYKIASMADTPDRAKELIFEHQEFLPYKNDSGKIEWRPSGIKPKTIDVNGIQNRFGSLNIKTDWEALKKSTNVEMHLSTCTQSIRQQKLRCSLPIYSRSCRRLLAVSLMIILQISWGRLGKSCLDTTSSLRQIWLKQKRNGQQLSCHQEL